jgi:3',5'-cyclic AMP phosphodiesterase CpdA
MPILTQPSAAGSTLSRRGFLALPAAVSVTLRASPTEARWALFSDTHVPANPLEEYRGFKPVVNFAMVVRQIEQAKLDGALVCGDLARLQGLPGDYDALVELVEPIANKFPLAFVLGNHDDRANFLKALGASQKDAQPVKNRHILAIDAGPVEIISLDSLIQPNSTPGFLGKVQREWLKERLAKQRKPTILAVHHTLDDGDGSLLDAPRLFEIVKSAPAVKAILYGHSHVYKYEVQDGVHLVNIPATGYNFKDSEPLGWLDTVFTPTGASFTLRAIGGSLEQNGKTVNLKWRS